MHAGEPLVRRAAAAALGAGAESVIVVLGAKAELIGPALIGLQRTRVVINPDWGAGMASSIAAGVRAAAEEKECEGVMLMLSDQPLVDIAALKRLILPFDTKRRVVAAGYGGTVGAPAIFGREHFPTLTSLKGDSGAGQWLKQHSREVTTIPMESAIVDIDTQADAALFRNP